MVGKEDTSRKQAPARLPTGEPTTASEQDADPLDCHFSLTNDREMSECFQHLPAEECCLNLPEDPAVDNPWTSRPLRRKYADRYPRKSVRGVNDVLCYVKPGDPPAN
jgi:hypothetical protein